MKKVPMRKCVACMESKPKKELYRIVRANDTDVVFDSTGKLNGRGLYVCGLECLNKAIKTKRINKLFDMSINEETLKKLADDISAYIK